MYPTLSYVLQQASAHVLATCPEHVPGCKCPPIVTPGSSGTVEIEVAGVPARVTVEGGAALPATTWAPRVGDDGHSASRIATPDPWGGRTTVSAIPPQRRDIPAILLGRYKARIWVVKAQREES